MPDAIPKAPAAPPAAGLMAGFTRGQRAEEPVAGNGLPGAKPHKRDGPRNADRQSALSHLIQGGVLLGLLVLLFVLAGFRG